MKFSTISLLLLLCSMNLRSQEVIEFEHEVGAMGGIANYYGDLNDHFGLKGISWSFEGFWRLNIGKRYAIKTGLGLSQVNYYDSYSNREFNRERNLSFHSQIFDVNAQFELNFLSLVRNVYYNAQGWPFSPYIFIGPGLFFFNPRAIYNGETYDLQPLGTEGQNDPDHTNLSKYNLFSFSINYGVGFKLHLKDNISFNVEFTSHRTFTDYLDDVSGTYAPVISLPEADKGIAYVLADRSEEVLGKRIGKPGYQRGSNDGNDDFATLRIGLSWTFLKPFCPKNLNEQ